ncbi:hypothetical protein [Umezawaea sp.]|uniref:hypothetical protein n=1 Tax=Umezawaea sp. TaxID=1955258 RepID=UPI002ED5F0C4
MITTRSGERQFQAVVHWRHEFGPAHCLARVQLSARPVAIVSEIRSSPDELGIGSEFPVVAGAVLAALPPDVEVAPEDVTWLAHYGEFSSYDAYAAPEDLDRVDLRWDGARYHGDLEDHHILEGDDAARLLAGVEFAPVPDVLGDLGWTY